MTILRNPLWRYNYKILLGTGFWILVLPIAASQVITIWSMAMGAFTPESAARIAEMMAPILGAFLAAHCLAPEYRSGTGTVLASKPVSLHRVVTFRVALAMLAALLLTCVTLGLCSLAVAPIPLLMPIAASLPSLWFLSMLALAFASLFRSAPAGFAVAAGVWAMDFSLGYGAHPFLSLQGYRAVLERDPMAMVWLYGKGVLLLAGFCLLLWHGRLLPALARKADRAASTQIAAIVAALVVFYCVSGAAAVVTYAYMNRGNMLQRDAVWLRRQLKNYGPIPVASFFGPTFSALVAEPPARDAQTNPTEVRVGQLRRALSRGPQSLWAPSVAMEIGAEQEWTAPAKAVEAYTDVADRYPSSPYAPKALAAVIRIESPDVPDTARLAAARRLVSDYSEAPEVEAAATTLWARYPAEAKPDEMLRAALAAASAGVRWTKPAWHLTAAEIHARQGRPSEAAAQAQAARDAALQLRQESESDSDGGIELTPHRARIDAALGEAEALLKRLKSR